MEQFLGLPPVGSEHGPAVDELIILIHWLMFVLFIGWGVFYLYTLLRFRKARNPQASYTGVRSHFSNYVEVAVLIAEIILLVGFSIPIWSKRVEAFPNKQEATVVRIVAEQFAWNIHYPGRDGIFGKTDIALVNSENPLGLDRTDPDAKDDITTINQLNLPVNKPVIVYLSSKDVIHSFNLTEMRVKQDVIPGISIPVWFKPVKTTDEIRIERQKGFSLTRATSQTKTIILPEIKKIFVPKGADLKSYIVMQDCTDKDGNIILQKGERLTSENVIILNDASITEINARPFEHFDTFVATQDYLDQSGNPLVSMGAALLDDVVNKLIDAGIKEVKARPISGLDLYVSMETYNNSEGSPIISKGEPLSEEVITALGDAGVKQMLIAPATPTEIACAQLCGLGHYRMRGYMTIQNADEFEKWYQEQEAAILEQYGSTEVNQNTTETTPQEIK